jgi:hypothetical protein
MNRLQYVHLDIAEFVDVGDGSHNDERWLCGAKVASFLRHGNKIVNFVVNESVGTCASVWRGGFH